jgi:serpin B
MKSVFSKGKIPDLLSKDSVNSQTRLILANALYFHGTWCKRFEKNRTKEMPFKINKVRNSILNFLPSDEEIAWKTLIVNV